MPKKVEEKPKKAEDKPKQVKDKPKQVKDKSKKQKPPQTQKNKEQEDFRLSLMAKIVKGLKKLKHFSMQKAIRRIKQAQGKKEEDLEKKIKK